METLPARPGDRDLDAPPQGVVIKLLGGGHWSDRIVEDRRPVLSVPLVYRIPASRAAIVFNCPDCGAIEEWPAAKLDDGTPTCDCGRDMKVGDEIIISEKDLTASEG
jgi:hypothetical protein